MARHDHSTDTSLTADSVSSDDAALAGATPTSDTEPAGAETAPAAPEGQAAGGEPAVAPKPRQTLAGRVWVAIGFAALLLVLVIIFIAENTKSITISFLGLHGHISEALALLIAVVVGMVIALLVGTARMLQLSLDARRTRKQLRKLS